MAPIKGFNELFTDLWHQRVANGTEAEQAALRGLHTMVSAAVQGRGTNGFRAQSSDGHRYELEAVSTDAAGAEIRFGRPDQAPNVHTTDNLLTRAGQILFNESLALGEEGTFNPRESLVTGLSTETLQAHRNSAASRVELAERVQDALQESINSPGQVSELVDDPSTDTQLSWLAPEAGSTAVYQQERLEDLVTDQGRDVLMGQTASAASPQDQVSTPTPETESGLVPDDLVTEHFRLFQDAAHSEASAMAEIEELIVSAAFGQDVDWQNSSHIHGQGPDMTVSFQTGVNEAGETTFTSLKVADLVDESVAEHLGIAEPAATDVSGVEAETEDTVELDTTVDNATEVEAATPSATEADPPANSVDVSTMFTEDFSTTKGDAIAHGSAGSTYQTAVHYLEDLMQKAAAGNGVNMEDTEAFAPEYEPDPWGVHYYDNHESNEGVQLHYWQLDGADGWLDSQDMLTPEGQAVLSAALDAGEGQTFNPQMVVRGVELETNGWAAGEQPNFDTPSLEDVLGADSSQLPEGPIGRWTQAEHETQAETPPAVGAGAHEMD